MNMKISRIILCAAVLASTGVAQARLPGEARQNSTISIDKDGDGPERFVARQRAASGQPSLVSTNRWSEMMLKDDAVHLQLTDYGMQQVGEAQDKDKSDEGFFSNMLKAVALSGVKRLLDHGLALSLTDMRSALVRDGEVVLVTCQGKEVFNKVKINDQVQKFPQDRAEAFANSVNRQRQKLPACRT